MIRVHSMINKILPNAEIQKTVKHSSHSRETCLSVSGVDWFSQVPSQYFSTRNKMHTFPTLLSRQKFVWHVRNHHKMLRDIHFANVLECVFAVPESAADKSSFKRQLLESYVG